MQPLGNLRKRNDARQAIISALGNAGASKELVNKFLQESFNNVADNKLGSAADYTAKGSVLDQFVQKVGAINNLGSGLSEAEKAKIIDNFSTADDISSISGRAQEYLGRTPSGDEIAR